MKNFLWILMVVAVTMPSCRNLWGKRIKGNGNIKTQEHTVGSFKNVEASGAIDLYVAQGDTKPVKIETDENLLQYIEVIQEGDKIRVESRDGVNLHPSRKIKVYVTSPIYNNIDVSGASNIIGVSKITNTERMNLDVSGAGDINMELDAPTVTAEVSGAGAVNLKGQTRTFELTLTGAGKGHCYDLMSENTKVEISGAGNAEVFASVKLDAQVSGAGSVTYKGGASNVSQNVSGAGSVKKVE